MKTFIIASSIAALLVGAAGPTMAQTADPQEQTQVAEGGDGMGHGDGHGDGKGHRGGKHGRHGDDHGGRGMRIIDANGDGVIGDEEAAAIADRMFSRIDADNDGALTETEFTTVRKGHRGWFNWSAAETDAVVKVRKEKFAALDADKDSKVTKAEFFADAKSRFAALDTDKDGKVSPWEFRAQN